jgi:UDP-N-acetylglucosamine 4,6-dehydratase/5-epimerase
MITNFKNSIILICGGSGSWGRELTKQLLECQPKKIIIYSRGEISQVDMCRQFNNTILDFVIGDIRDKDSLESVFFFYLHKGNPIDCVFQLAALKHVPVCEAQPDEAILTNIIGMQNVIDLSIKYAVKRFVDVSTDKAVEPINVYGLTKAIGERLTLKANERTATSDFICIRGGNVIGTNGSLIPYVIQQIKEENRVRITDENMTRFFLTIQQAIKLLITATTEAERGTINIIHMPSFYILDVVNVLIEVYGNVNTQIEIIGARKGEKVHEVLVSENDVAYFPNAKRVSSEDNLKDRAYLYNLLKESGWIQ